VLEAHVVKTVARHVIRDRVYLWSLKLIGWNYRVDEESEFCGVKERVETTPMVPQPSCLSVELVSLEAKSSQFRLHSINNNLS